MTSLGWIDFSSEDSAKVRTALDLLSDTGVIDELGIGVIGDSFADRMFPGISTVQTRPKYFTLTAHLLKNYVDRELTKRRPRSLPEYLEDEEKRCRIELANAHGEGRQNLCHRVGMDDLVASVGRISVVTQFSADRRGGGASQIPSHGSLAPPVHLHVSDLLSLEVVQLSMIPTQVTRFRANSLFQVLRLVYESETRNN